MASLLELPRELYLMVCSHLTPKDISKLAGVGRDHYLAAQQPLFFNVDLPSYSTLVKLVGTLMKAPIVSHISSRQRLHWHKLSDEQLRERDIKHLTLLLDCRKEGGRITGATFERCIGAISRKCPGVNIAMTLYGVWRDFAKQLEYAEILGVKKLTMFLGQDRTDPADTDLLKMRMWDLTFSGSTFPDLEDVSLNTLVESAEDMPACILDGLDLVHEKYRPRGYDNMTPTGDAGYYGLRNMKKIKLEYNTFLTPAVLRSLFGSSIIPKRLTTLEIVNCPCLDPVKDLEALATLFKRGLQLLRLLKVHLVNEYCLNDEHYGVLYSSKVQQHPEHHLCNIVRVLGQNIKGLDLALPFACNRIFEIPLKMPRKIPYESLMLPQIPEEPINTLPQRLMDAGYRYRRLIFYGICREAHTWEEMEALASNQSGNVSWEILSEADDKALWCVSDCLPVEFSVQGALQHPFHDG